MSNITKLTGSMYLQLIKAGTSNLRAHVKEVNDLNVFPIPDGDTGDNMLLTMQSGAKIMQVSENLSETALSVARGMLLGARGNSGVILSQFFDGIAEGFKNLESADVVTLGNAFNVGVQHAYNSVLNPTEGTILTVIKDASNKAYISDSKSTEGYMTAFIEEAKASLNRTPELLEVLKKAGVVDSGGAGLIYIMEGMLKSLKGENISELNSDNEPDLDNEHIDFSLFDENSKMTFGYCTELLVRLQNKKTDPENFNTKNVTDYLETIGDSIVAVKTGTVLKIHVHTLTPEKVLEFCRKYGEFLTVKIENMNLQHSNSPLKSEPENIKEHTVYGVVAVASGEGVKQTFLDIGADVVVDGGQSMNPSTEDFIKAFDDANADNIFVFPNNSNIILAAKQAANIYEKSNIFVLESKTIGDGYAAISMMNTELSTPAEIIEEFNFAMEGVITAEISKSVKDSHMQHGVDVTCGDYIGFVGKDILASCPSRLEAAEITVDKAEFCDHDVCIIIRGIDSDENEAQQLLQHIKENNPMSEVYIIDGGQNIYSYILIAE